VPLQLHSLCFDAHDPGRLAHFWAVVLCRELMDGPGGPTLLSDEAPGFQIRFLPSDAERRGLNQMHFDLTSQSQEEQDATVARALDLGARHLDVGQGPDEEHVVLADPEGNEFCVIEPGNRFLAGCGRIGALSSDGSQAVGYFWAEALGWPLVWDQDEETAIQSPSGGTKISWGGPPFDPKLGKNRLHLDLLPTGDQAADVDRLVALGASLLLDAPHDDGSVVLADPDGNELCVLVGR
jgi:hypothetical protein